MLSLSARKEFQIETSILRLSEQNKEKAKATHSSSLAWKIPWTEEPGRLQSMGSRRVRHNWATSLSLFTFLHWRRKWQPFQCSCLENPRDGGAWWAAVYGVAQSRTRLKRLSSSSSSSNPDSASTVVLSTAISNGGGSQLHFRRNVVSLSKMLHCFQSLLLYVHSGFEWAVWVSLLSSQHKRTLEK